MQPKVYVETSIVSYLAARPSRDVVIAGHQQSTRDWWETRSQDFKLVASQLVVQEASAGDARQAQQRLSLLTHVELLATSESALALAETLVSRGAVPEKAAADALHIAIAVTNGVEYLLTWNCKHIANASTRSKIERLCQAQGYEPTIICTPDEL